MNPKVSIIIIIYKVGRFLEQCLNSVANQTYENLEIICVVGKGDELCEKICDDFAAGDNRFIIIKEEPRGTAVARNTGLDAATGDYIAFVDGDDYIDCDMVEVMVDAAKRHAADISVVGKYLAYENMIEGSAENVESVMNTEEAFRTILYYDGFFFHIWDKLYRKSIFEDIRFPVGKLVEDRQISARLIEKAEKIVYNSASKYYFRVSEDSGSRIEENLRLSLKADYEICEELSKIHPGLRQAIDYFLVNENMSALQNSMIFGTFSKNHDREYMDYIIKNVGKLKNDSHYDRNMMIKVFLVKFAPGLLCTMTVKKRKAFLESHISFSTGADWEKTFSKQGSR